MPAKKLHISKRPATIIALIIISILIAFASYFRVFEIFELATLDLRFKARPAQEVSDKIAIIEIAQDTLDQIGTWPIDREFHAQLIDVLTEFGAHSIIFDVMFAQQQNEFSDEALIQAARSSGRVYLAHAFKVKIRSKDSIFPEAEQIEAQPFSGFDKAASGIGHINIIPDRDGKRRRSPIFIDYKGRLYPQMSFLAACDYLGIPQGTVKINKEFVQVDPNRLIPIDENGQMLINFAGKWEAAFKHYSFVDILKAYIQLKDNETPGMDLNVFKDKICLVGLTAAGTHDLNPMPLESNYPMLGVHANVINSILTKNFIRRAAKLTNIIVLVFLGLLVSFLTLKLKPLKSLSIITGSLFVFVLSTFFIFSFFKIWLDLFYPVLLISLVYLFVTFYKYTSERNKRLLIERELDIARNIQKSFLKETPPEKKGLDMAVIMDAAKAVGGDLYDFVDLSEDEIGVMIGDVSGKGVPAALFMAMTVSDFRFHARAKHAPAEVVTQLNNQISSESTSGLFVTVYYLIADLKNKILRIADAGHLPLVAAKGLSSPESIKAKGGMAIGIMQELDYEETHVPFDSKDVFLLYTDGVTEARNIKKEEFGEERIKRALWECKTKSAKEIVDYIYKRVKTFIGKAPQHDDITMIAIKIK